jgi:hypothetical protein
MSANADCPVCGHTTDFDSHALDAARIILDADTHGKKWLIYLVTCERCQQVIRAGGKDGRGGV